MGDLMLHVIFFGWKLLFALVPPNTWGGGWWCFCISLIVIGMITAVIGEFAMLLGCVIGLEDSVTAIVLVALGTSLPDTFASMAAAQDSADNAVGNVTGSNAVNVFLGLGIPWTVSALYYTAKGETMKQPAGPLATSVVTFSITALACIGTLVARRWYGGKLGGELGGSACGKWLTFAWFLCLWLTYVTVSILVAYDAIDRI